MDATTTTTTVDAAESRSVWRAMARGAAGRCPRCGDGAVFDGFLRVAPACGSCGLALEGHRADDLPPYVAILVVGKITMAALTVMMGYGLPTSVIYAVTVVLALGGALALLRPIKGAVVGLQWAWRMHGFADDHPGAETTAGPPRP
ncbi:MAG: DUF983 domain-containing protein [Pseudomonadota bacterium]